MINNSIWKIQCLEEVVVTEFRFYFCNCKIFSEKKECKKLKNYNRQSPKHWPVEMNSIMNAVRCKSFRQLSVGCGTAQPETWGFTCRM